MQSMFSKSPEKHRAAKAFTAFTIFFFVVSIGIGQLLSQRIGHGSGPWNSHLTWNCYAQGGPYYLKDKPIAEQPCPSPLATSTIKAGGQIAKTAAIQANPLVANPGAAQSGFAGEPANAKVEGSMAWFILKEFFLIGTSIGFMLLLILWWKWLLQNLGTY